MTDLEMPGLSAGPMGAWLAAVGVLRMQSRRDPGATLHWDGLVPVLTTASAVPVRDIADRVPFTPVITPWQSGGGWGPKDKAPRDRLASLRATRSPRLDALRRSVAVADDLTGRRSGGTGKDDLVRLLRGALPADALPWLDVAVPLRSLPGQPGVTAAGPAPLAGSGGNDARWDVSANYHAGLLALAPDREPGPDGATGDPVVARRRGWLHDLIDGTQDQPLADMSLGPYWPGMAGLANPWAIVLAAEGLCAFGDSPRREHGAAHQPWTTAAGPESDREAGHGEAWLPMWGEPVTMAEAALILGGTQPRWRGKGARTPAQMYASLRSCGWPPGVTGYARYALAQRRGHGHVAAALDIVTPAAIPALTIVLTSAQAAEAAGVGESTFRAYVARGQAPAPDGRDLMSGQPGWYVATISTWMAVRPGRGARTDL